MGGGEEELGVVEGGGDCDQDLLYKNLSLIKRGKRKRCLSDSQ